MKNQIITSTVLLTLLVFSICAVWQSETAKATEIVGILNSDTIWTLGNSPYVLTGPVAVNIGVTLTIEAGATVNLNNYYIQVNGTLIARGTGSSLIQFSSGTLRFTPVSNGWNDQTGTGSIIENAALFSVAISSSNALKISKNTVSSGSISVGDSSVIAGNTISTSNLAVGKLSTLENNEISGNVNAGERCTFSNNKVGSISSGDKSTVTNNIVEGAVVCAGDQSEITKNIIKGRVNGGVITNNTITSSFRVNVQGTTVSNNNITGGTVIASSKITNNNIISGNYTEEFRVFGGYATYTENTPAIKVNSGSVLISGNTIIGGGKYVSAFIWTSSETPVPAIDVSSATEATISDNVITGILGLAINGNSYLISNNIVTGDINGSASIVQNNNIQGSLTINSGNPAISNNIISKDISVNTLTCNITGNTANGINSSWGTSYISDNTVKNGKGISITGEATIIRNFVANATSGAPFLNGTSIETGAAGISITNGPATILNNTISNNNIGIKLYSASSETTIHYNNMLSNGLNVGLVQSANNIDAAYNWWGTTNTATINQSIFDNKRDFNLGTVTFTPFLTASNPQASPINPPPFTPTPAITPTPTPTQTPFSTPTEPSPTSNTQSSTPGTAQSPQPSNSPSYSEAPLTTQTPPYTSQPARTQPDQQPTVNIIAIVVVVAAVAFIGGVGVGLAVVLKKSRRQELHKKNVT